MREQTDMICAVIRELEAERDVLKDLQKAIEKYRKILRDQLLLLLNSEPEHDFSSPNLD